MIMGNGFSLLLNRIKPEGLETFESLSSQAAQVSAFGSVLLAIPLLLMVNSVTSWLKYTGKITLVFFAGVASTVLVCITMGYLFRNHIPEIATTSGMLTGVYIGGTPNMVAISKALNADDHLFIILNATDTICSGSYFFLLLGFGKAVVGLVLPPFRSVQNSLTSHASEEEVQQSFPPKYWHWVTLRPIIIAIGVSIIAVLLSLIPAILIPDLKGELNQTVLMLTLTTVGIGLSFIRKLRTLPGAFSFANYLLLIFGVSAGFLTNFTKLVDVGGQYLLFNACVIICIILLHLMLTRLIRGDVDSFMMSSTAAVMGPPFVAQISSAIKKKELMPAGIALSLLGLGLANYAGVLVAWVVGRF